MYTSNDILEKSTYYPNEKSGQVVLDAQEEPFQKGRVKTNGRRTRAVAMRNTISVYEREVDAPNQSITYEQTEKHNLSRFFVGIYGSSRLGVMNTKVPLLGTQNNTYSQASWTHTIGEKTFEISNHLEEPFLNERVKTESRPKWSIARRNVLAVISDKPIPNDFSGTTNITHFLADIRHSSDYSPFGVTLEGRDFALAGAVGYRYGYQGSEQDNEIKGNGNSYTTHFRQLDPRVGRWLSIDPVFKASDSPYLSMSNNPIIMLDPKGDDDYYNEYGAWLYKDDKTTNAVKIIPQDSWTKIRNAYNLSPYPQLPKMNLESDEVRWALEQHSASTFERNDLYKVLKDWGDNYVPQSEDCEFAMGIFALDIQSSSGTKTVYLSGSTVKSEERSEVNPDYSILSIDGKQMAGKEVTKHFGGSIIYLEHGNIGRFAVVHSHSTGSESKEISAADITFSINTGSIVYMFSYESKALYKYEPNGKEYTIPDVLE